MRCKRRTTPARRHQGSAATSPGRPAAVLPPPIPDEPSAALDQAQELIYEAWEIIGRKRRLALAERALRISPLCADAWSLLAEEGAATVRERASYYQKALKAAEKALGKQKLQDLVGHFWLVLETRPYMRARAGLARALWDLEQREKAIGHYRELMRLNPFDNQGIRFHLLAALLELGRDRDALDLLQIVPAEPAAALLYSRALIEYRSDGDTPQARRRAKEALEFNPFVPGFLLGRKRPPKKMPDYYSYGDAREAAIFAGSFLPGWKNTPGALEWLARQPRPQ